MKKRKTCSKDPDEVLSNLDKAKLTSHDNDRAPKLAKFMPINSLNIAEIPDFVLPALARSNFDEIKPRSLSIQVNKDCSPLPFLTLSPDTNDGPMVFNENMQREMSAFSPVLNLQDLQGCPRCLIGKAFNWDEVSNSLSEIADHT